MGSNLPPIETVFTASLFKRFATAGGDPISDATAARASPQDLQSGVFDAAVLKCVTKWPMHLCAISCVLPPATSNACAPSRHWKQVFSQRHKDPSRR
jgi:hypothetical protein